MLQSSIGVWAVEQKHAQVPHATVAPCEASCSFQEHPQPHTTMMRLRTLCAVHLPDFLCHASRGGQRLTQRVGCEANRCHHTIHHHALQETGYVAHGRHKWRVAAAMTREAAG